MKNTLFVPALLSMQLVTTISGQAPPRRDTNGTNNAATSPAESMKWIQVRPGQETRDREAPCKTGRFPMNSGRRFMDLQMFGPLFIRVASGQ
jgi:hypothetical protein